MKVADFIKALQSAEDFTVTLIPDGAPNWIVDDYNFFKKPEEWECGDSIISTFRIDGNSIFIYCY